MAPFFSPGPMVLHIFDPRIAQKKPINSELGLIGFDADLPRRAVRAIPRPR